MGAPLGIPPPPLVWWKERTGGIVWIFGMMERIGRIVCIFVMMERKDWRDCLYFWYDGKKGLEGFLYFWYDGKNWRDFFTRFLVKYIIFQFEEEVMCSLLHVIWIDIRTIRRLWLHFAAHKVNAALKYRAVKS